MPLRRQNLYPDLSLCATSSPYKGFTRGDQVELLCFHAFHEHNLDEMAGCRTRTQEADQSHKRDVMRKSPYRNAFRGVQNRAFHPFSMTKSITRTILVSPLHQSIFTPFSVYTVPTLSCQPRLRVRILRYRRFGRRWAKHQGLLHMIPVRNQVRRAAQVLLEFCLRKACSMNVRQNLV